jgi:hypothetical protein
MIAGLASNLPKTLASGLTRHGVPQAAAQHIATLPPVASLFAAVLGVNPIRHLLAANGVLASLPTSVQRVLTGREFFPHLIAAPFDHGLSVVFAGGALLTILAGAASLLRGQPIRADRPAGRAGRRPSVPSARR